MRTTSTDEASLARAIELTQIVRRNGQSFVPEYTFGWVRLKNGEAIAALPVLQKAAEMDPDSAIMRYHLGVALCTRPASWTRRGMR